MIDYDATLIKIKQTAEVYLAIKSAFTSLKGLSENSLEKQYYQRYEKDVQGAMGKLDWRRPTLPWLEEKDVQCAMGKLDALIKAPKKSLAEYAKCKEGISDAIIADVEPIFSASGDHDLYVQFYNISVYIDHWITDGKNEIQGKKIVAESRRLNNILELQNSNMFVRPFKKFFQKFQR